MLFDQLLSFSFCTVMLISSWTPHLTLYFLPIMLKLCSAPCLLSSCPLAFSFFIKSHLLISFALLPVTWKSISERMSWNPWMYVEDRGERRLAGGAIIEDAQVDPLHPSKYEETAQCWRQTRDLKRSGKLWPMCAFYHITVIMVWWKATRIIVPLLKPLCGLNEMYWSIFIPESINFFTDLA